MAPAGSAYRAGRAAKKWSTFVKNPFFPTVLAYRGPCPPFQNPVFSVPDILGNAACQLGWRCAVFVRPPGPRAAARVPSANAKPGMEAGGITPSSEGYDMFRSSHMQTVTCLLHRFTSRRLKTTCHKARSDRPSRQPRRLTATCQRVSSDPPARRPPRAGARDRRCGHRQSDP